MQFDELNRLLNGLFDTRDGGDCVFISPWIHFDGEGTVFRFTMEDRHTCRIETDRNFTDWFGYITLDWEDYREEIAMVTTRFGTEWDATRGVLSISFRRNEMPLAEALLKLEQCMLILSNFRGHIYFRDKQH